MQDLTLSFTSTRERRTSDDTLRDQLAFIAKRALAGNRGRGWDFEVATISDDKVNRSGGGAGYELTANIKFFRRVDIDSERFTRQSSEIAEWAGAAGHNARFQKRPWVIQISKEDNNKITKITVDTKEEEDISASSGDEIVSLKEIGIIRPGKFFDHLYGLDAQIRVLLSSVQAAIDSSLENRFHSLLYGDPACGKTEILQSLARLLSKEGVSFIILDGTSTTEAGIRKILLDEDNDTPDVILIEEIEKAPENSFRWLLGVMDDRALVQQTNYRKTASRQVKALVLATANDYNLLAKMMYGALLSRFSNEIHCPRPDRTILARILEREVRKLTNGRLEWIEPTLKFAYDGYGLTDPRQLRRICLSGKDNLITGEYQKDLIKTMKLGNKPITLSVQGTEDL